jgi:hypothetical protein
MAPQSTGTNGPAARGDAGGGLEHLEHRLAAPHRVLEPVLVAELAAEGAVLGGEPALLEGAGGGELHRVHVVGLGDVVEGAAADRLDGAVHVAEGGDQDDRRVGRVAPERLGDGEAVHLRHADVRHHEVRRLPGREPLEGLAAVGELLHLPAALSEDAGEELAARGVVVDDPDPVHGRGPEPTPPRATRARGRGT